MNKKEFLIFVRRIKMLGKDFDVKEVIVSKETFANLFNAMIKYSINDVIRRSYCHYNWRDLYYISVYEVFVTYKKEGK